MMIEDRFRRQDPGVVKHPFHPWFPKFMAACFHGGLGAQLLTWTVLGAWTNTTETSRLSGGKVDFYGTLKHKHELVSAEEYQFFRRMIFFCETHGVFFSQTSRKHQQKSTWKYLLDIFGWYLCSCMFNWVLHFVKPRKICPWLEMMGLGGWPSSNLKCIDLRPIVWSDLYPDSWNNPMANDKKYIDTWLIHDWYSLFSKPRDVWWLIASLMGSGHWFHNLLFTRFKKKKSLVTFHYTGS